MIYEIEKCENGDSLYPKAMTGLKGMPQYLFFKGDISILNKDKAVAIVGSRECSDKALTFAKDAGRCAAKSGFVVVNGLAVGCDTAAILGALEAGGKCAAVMPCGLNNVYPKSNEKLAYRILDMGGCLVSEYEPDFEPKKYSYAQRDRLQSALSQGVLVVEASLGSGTMYTVKAAIRQYRRLAAYADKINEATGNKYVIDKGNMSVSNMEELSDFFMTLGKEAAYEQLTLF